MAKPTRSIESWGTRVGVILAVTGSAVGLGNFLRFPGQAAQNGGGSFLIPYIVAFILLGLPIAWVEWALGRYGGRKGFNSLPGIFRSVWGRDAGAYAGVLGLIIPVMIYMYYVFVEAWCLAYAFQYLTGGLRLGANPGAYEDHFNHFVGINQNGSAFGTSAIWFLIVCFVINFVLIYRGLSKGIEWFCKWAMPALVICALIVLVRVLTLGTPNPDLPDQNLVNGLGAMWNPAREGQTMLQSLARPEIWVAAAGQIFFSLSVGFGIVITYSSYLKRDDDVALSGMTAAAGNGWCEVALGGMITIPAAFVFLGQAFVDNPPGTFGMGFVALPSVFNQMPAGSFFGFLFFFLLFLAAVTSSLSMLQPAIAFLEEGIGVDRKVSVTLLSLITALGSGFIVYFSQSLLALDTIDFWVGTVCIYLLATIQVVLFAWVLGINKGLEELRRGAEMPVPGWIGPIIKYVAPVYLLLLFGWFVYDQVRQTLDPETSSYLDTIAENRTAQLSVGLVLLTAVFFTLLTVLAVRRWRENEAAQQEASS